MTEDTTEPVPAKRLEQSLADELRAAKVLRKMAENPPCWVLVHPDGGEFDQNGAYGVRHYASPELARDAIPEDYDLSPRLLLKPCAFVVCAECETRLDEDGDNYLIHCADADEALAYARDFGWTVVGESTWCNAEECEAVALNAKDATR